MEIECLITSRRVNHELYMDLVYEWEDEIRQTLQIPFYYEKSHFRGKRLLLKCIKKWPILSFLLQTQKKSFVFELNEIRHNCLNNQPNIIPCIIDFYLKESEINSFVESHNRNRIVFVTNRQAYCFLQKHNLPFQVEYLPLSLPSRYRISRHTRFDKKYDLIVAGRSNPVLVGFVNQYASLHPEFVYVFRLFEHGRVVYYSSRGDCLGAKNTREDYISLLRKVRVGLYSTSGMDNDKAQTDTNGYHQVTPRFLELLACGCHVIARYERNSDTDFYKMSDYWPSVECYEQFEKQLDAFLNVAPDMDFYSKYLSNHYTGERISQLNRKMSELSFI